MRIAPIESVSVSDAGNFSGFFLAQKPNEECRLSLDSMSLTENTAEQSDGVREHIVAMVLCQSIQRRTTLTGAQIEKDQFQP